ncbi:MAG: NAD(P)/FAD-dependent oxidoreductase [Burkholderiaceae bacterium]|nr:MAG: NAD(P)/FAD-dependent oxidoreductase [Burkholderiaceae bacterium]
MQNHFDLTVIGAGAAGMMCASVAAQRGLRVVLIDHAERLAEKIRISGGGRCNFTNLHASPKNFLSRDPHFARFALKQYTVNDFLALMKRHRISWHEKHKGQLFCDESSEQIIQMLRHECETGKVHWRMPCAVSEIGHDHHGFQLHTNAGTLHAKHLVIATGGLSIPKIGATDFGYRIARQFGLKIIEPRPALVPLTFDAEHWQPFVDLAGLSLQVQAHAGEKGQNYGLGTFDEDLLFTHRGLSGPGILQISSYWQSGQPIRLNLCPEISLEELLIKEKQTSKQNLNTILGQILPKRLAQGWLEAHHPDIATRRIAEVGDKTLRQLAQGIQHWQITPNGSEGYKKAEVTIGGVDTAELDPKTMQVKKIPGLYFIGEVVDVTGWLGGYNFQWAWSSGYVAGQAIG